MSTEAKIKLLDLNAYEGHAPGKWTVHPADEQVLTEDGCAMRKQRVGHVCGPYDYGNGEEGFFSIPTAKLVADAPLLLAELSRNRRLLEAGERLADAACGFFDDKPFAGGKLRLALDAYQEAAKK